MNWKEFHRLLKRVQTAQIEKQKHEAYKGISGPKLKARSELFTAQGDLATYIRRNLDDLVAETEKLSK